MRRLGALAAAVLLLAGCHTGSAGPAPSSAAPTPGVDYPSGPVTMSAGANPGSGLDLTIRAVVDSLQQSKLVDVPLPVQNRPGHIGADCLAGMVEQYRGADDQVSATSLSMMMNQLRGISRYGFEDVTMIARVMTEYFVVVTDAGSRYTSLGDVLAALKADPGRVEVAAASDDQAPFDLLVKAGGDPAQVRYVPLEGGAEQAKALLDANVSTSVAIGGVSEFIGQIRSGELRGLGVLSEQRLPGLDVPTAREQGFDVTLSNWRGLYGPPGMPGYAVAYWQKVLGQMVQTPAWKQIAERSQFTTTFMAGRQFHDFLVETQADVKAALAAEH